MSRLNTIIATLLLMMGTGAGSTTLAREAASDLASDPPRGGAQGAPPGDGATETGQPAHAWDHARLARLVRAIDPDAQARGLGWQMIVEGQLTLLMTDGGVGRLRVMVPIRPAEGLTQPDMQRMLSANFDTALDGRYAVSQGLVWSIYVAPLAGLETAQLISGLAQAVTLAQSYGYGFSSGMMRFGGQEGPGQDGIARDGAPVAPLSPPTGPGLYHRLLERGEDI